MSESTLPPSGDAARPPPSIYAWLACPSCGSRGVVRGPRNADGTVEICCEDCGLTGRYSL